MTVLEKTYRFIWHFFMALSSTALLPAIYFIKIGCRVWHFRSDTLSLIFDILLYLGIPLIMSLISLFWMKNQSDDSINNGVNEIAPVNHEYLPIYLGYIFV